jgi:outer membrane receptor protein involved in Fe transport
MHSTVTHLLAALALLVVSTSRAADADDLEQLLATPVYAASKYKQSVTDAPATVTVLTQGDIRSFGWRTLGDVLGGVRGVFTRYDRNYTYLGVRGISRPGDYSSRLLLLIDGVRANDNIYDSVLVGREFPIDVALIERVEFIPGPGSAIYGSNAVFGTINVVTRNAASLRGQSLTLSTDSQLARKVQFSSTHEFARGSLLLAASAENRPGSDLVIPEFDPAGGEGRVSNLDGERDRKLQLRWNAGELSLSAISSQRAKTIPNAPYGLVFGERSVWTDRLTLLAGSWQRLSPDGSGWSVETGLGLYDYHDSGRYEPDRYLATYRNQGRWWQAEVRRTVRLDRAHMLLFGASLQHNVRQRSLNTVYGPDGPETADDSTDGVRYGLFVTDEISIGRTVKLGLGARVDRETSNRWHATPRLSVVWQPASEWVVRALAGEAYREPNFFEKAPASIGEAWNETLHRERVQSYELAADWRAGERLRISGSLFDSRVRALIEQVERADGVLEYRNVGSAHAHGVELEAEVVAPAGWRLRASLTHQRVHLGDGAEPSNAPRTLLKLHATTPLPSQPLRLALELQGTGTRYTLSGQRLGSQLVANTTLSWDPPGRAWSLAASVYNVGNRRLADPAGPEFLADRIEQDGRVVALRWTLTF